jgi:hypothetical protein
MVGNVKILMGRTLSLGPTAVDDSLAFCEDQLVIWDMQSQISSLRNDRDNGFRALNLARDLLNPTFPAFSLDFKDLLSSVESFASSVPSRLVDQHIQAVEERDDFRAANKDYADELRALRAEHFACVRQLSCLTAENLQLQAEIDSLLPPSSS